MATYELTNTGKEFLERLKRVLTSKHFPKGEYRESTKRSIALLENDCDNPHGRLIQISSVLSYYSNLEMDSRTVLSAKSLEVLQEKARIYEEIRALLRMLPGSTISNKNNSLYTFTTK